MITPKLTLISHHLCPFVQRAAIALLEKDTPFERRYIDLGNKPDWFLGISPLGKVPVLVVDDEHVLFESSVIAQYINEITGGGLLSGDPIEKSQQLAWMEFASQLIANIGQLYDAKDNASFDAAKTQLGKKLQRVDDRLDDGPWFSGETFSLVDAAFAPAFRYFDVIDSLLDEDLFAATSNVAAWRAALSLRPSVRNAVAINYSDCLLSFLAKRDSVLGGSARTAMGEPVRAA